MDRRLALRLIEPDLAKPCFERLLNKEIVEDQEIKNHFQIFIMSKRDQIVDGSDPEQLKRNFGIIYTCNMGWVDIGHAGPGAVDRLWALIRNEIGEKSPDGKWFRVPFEECMGKKEFG